MNICPCCLYQYQQQLDSKLKIREDNGHVTYNKFNILYKPFSRYEMYFLDFTKNTQHFLRRGDIRLFCLQLKLPKGVIH